MCLEIKLYAMFNINHNIILQYSTYFWAQVIFFAHNTYFEDLLLELRRNSYKVELVCYVTKNESEVDILGWTMYTGVMG